MTESRFFHNSVLLKNKNKKEIYDVYYLRQNILSNNNTSPFNGIYIQQHPFGECSNFIPELYDLCSEDVHYLNILSNKYDQVLQYYLANIIQSNSFITGIDCNDDFASHFGLLLCNFIEEFGLVSPCNHNTYNEHIIDYKNLTIKEVTSGYISITYSSLLKNFIYVSCDCDNGLRSKYVPSTIYQESKEEMEWEINTPPEVLKQQFLDLDSLYVAKKKEYDNIDNILIDSDIARTNLKKLKERLYKQDDEFGRQFVKKQINEFDTNMILNNTLNLQYAKKKQALAAEITSIVARNKLSVIADGYIRRGMTVEDYKRNNQYLKMSDKQKRIFRQEKRNIVNTPEEKQLTMLDAEDSNVEYVPNVKSGKLNTNNIKLTMQERMEKIRLALRKDYIDSTDYKRLLGSVKTLTRNIKNNKLNIMKSKEKLAMLRDVDRTKAIKEQMLRLTESVKHYDKKNKVIFSLRNLTKQLIAKIRVDNPKLNTVTLKKRDYTKTERQNFGEIQKAKRLNRVLEKHQKLKEMGGKYNSEIVDREIYVPNLVVEDKEEIENTSEVPVVFGKRGKILTSVQIQRIEKMQKRMLRNEKRKKPVISQESSVDELLQTLGVVDFDFVKYILLDKLNLCGTLEYVTDVITPIIIFLYKAYKTDSVLNIALDLMSLAHAFGVTTTSILKTVCGPLISQIVEAFKVHAVEVKQESFVDEVEEKHFYLSKLLHSSLLTRIRDFVLTLLSLKLFDKNIAQKVYSYIGKPKSLNIVDAFEFIISSIVSFLRVGESLMKGVPFSEVLYADNPVQTLIVNMKELLYYKDKLYSGLKVDGMMDKATFCAKAIAYKQTADIYLAKLNPTSTERGVLFAVNSLIGDAILDVKRQLQGQKRPVPYAIILHGLPGTGKSMLLPVIVELYCELRGIDYSDHVIYHRIASSQYFEGYEPLSMLAMHYSEVGAINENLAATKGDDLVMELLNLIDNLPMALDMAFGDKGKVFACPEIVIIDTNNAGMNLTVLVRFRSAYDRRFLLIEVFVKPEWTAEGSKSIDTAKSLADPTRKYLDRYYFNVYRFNKVITKEETKRTDYLSAANRNDIYDLVAWLSKDMKRHIEEQQRILQISQGANILHEYINKEEKKDVVPFQENNELEEKEYEAPYQVNTELEDKGNSIVLHNKPTNNHKQKVKTITETYQYRIHSRLYWMYLFIKNLLIYVVLQLAYHITNFVAVRHRGPVVCWKDLIFLIIELSCMSIKNPYYFFVGYYGYLLHYTIFLLRLPIFKEFFKSSYASKMQDMIQVRANQIFLLFLDKSDIDILSSSWFQRNKDRVIFLTKLGLASVVVYKTYKTLTKRHCPCSETVYEDEPATPVKAENLDVEINAIETMLNVSDSVCKIPIQNNYDTFNTMHILKREGVHTGSIEELEKKILKNARKVYVVSTVSGWSHILFIGGDYVLINAHVVRYPETRVYYTEDPTREFDKNQLSKCDFFIVNKDNSIVVSDDVMLVRNFKSNFKDITAHIMSEESEVYAPLGVIASTNVTLIQLDKTIDMLSEKRDNDSRVRKPYVYKFPNHYKGMCGLPLIIKLGQRSVVVGIHCAGDSLDRGYSAPFTLKKITLAKEQLMNRTVILPFLENDEEVIPYDTTLPINKSPVNFVKLNNMKYYGKLPGYVKLVKKSALTRTAYFRDMEAIFAEQFDLFIDDPFTKPQMKACVNKEGLYISPQNNMLMNISLPKPALCPNVMSHVVLELTIELIKRHPGLRLSPISMEDAINGCEEDVFIKRMNISTSAGFGFSSTLKKDMMSLDDFSKKRVCHKINDEVKQRILRIFGHYFSDKMSVVINSAHPKDEPRKLSKVIQGKTRFFFITPMDYLIVARMLLAPLYSLMVKDSFKFNTAVGINMEGKGERVYNFLAEYSEVNIIEGDFSGFDQRLPIEVGVMASSVVYQLCKYAGYNESDLKCVSGILSDAMFPYVELNKDLFMMPGLQPSGKYCTAEDNSLRNLCLVMYVWYSYNTDNFFEFVRPITYGDDLLIAVKESHKDKFNSFVLEQGCRELLGMTFTTASKNSIVSPFIKLQDASFLKRSFAKHALIKQIVTPLDLESILKSLMWYLPSKELHVRDQLYSSICSSLSSLVLHCNELQFNVIRMKIVRLFNQYYKHDLDVKRFPTFYQILHYHFTDAQLTSNHSSNEINYTLRELVCNGNFEELNIYEEGDLISDKINPTLNYTLLGLKTQTNKKLLSSNKINEENQNFTQKHLTPLDILFQYKTRLQEVDNLLSDSVYAKISYKNLQQRLTHYKSGSVEQLELKRILKLKSEKTALLSGIRNMKEIVDDNETIVTESSTVGDMTAGQSEARRTEQVTDFTGDSFQDGNGGKLYSTTVGDKGTTELQDFLKRPVLLHKEAIAISSRVSIEIEPWELFFRHPSIRAKFRNYPFVRCDLNLRISVSGSPFHYGNMIAAYLPFPFEIAAWENLQVSVAGGAHPNLRVNYLSQTDGSVVISPRQNVATEIHIPYIMPKPLIRLYYDELTTPVSTYITDLAGIGKFYLEAINPLRAASSTATPVYVQIYAWADNVNFGSNTATQTIVLTESTEEANMGPIESIATRFYDISSGLAHISFLKPYTTATSLASGAMKSIAHIFGWSKPISTQPKVEVKPNAITNISHLAGQSHAQKISLDPKSEITVAADSVGIDTDQLVLQNICARRTFLDYFQWTSEDIGLGAPLRNYRINPALCTVSNISTTQYVQPTALAYAAAPFMYWRGDITFRIEVVCSQFHRGKLAIIYEPNINQYAAINANLSLNKQYLKIMDIQDTQSLDLTVKWASDREWLKVNTTYEAQLNTTFTYPLSASHNYVNGYIIIVPFTELQSPDGSAAFVNVYVSSDNMHFNGLTSRNMPRNRKYYNVGLVEEKEESVIEQEMSVCSNTPEVVPKYDLNESTATTDGISEKYFGEEPISFRTILKRYITNERLNSIANSTGDILYIGRQLFPISNLPYSTTSADVPSNLWSYLRYAFLGYTGSIRYYIDMDLPDSGTMSYGMTQVRLSSPATSFSNTYTKTDGTARPSLNIEGTVVAHNRVNGMLEFEIPFYTNNLFIITCNDTMDCVASPEIFDGNYFRNWVWNSLAMSTTVVDARRIFINVASGEDFNFLRYLSAPYYTTNIFVP